MLANYNVSGVKTTKTRVSGSIGVIKSTGTARSSQTITQKRGKVRRLFAGGSVFNSNSSTQVLTATLTITNGTNSFPLDRIAVQVGDSIVWNEEDYGVVLDEDQYAEVTFAETIANNDNAYIFLHTKEIL